MANDGASAGRSKKEKVEDDAEEVSGPVTFARKKKSKVHKGEGLWLMSFSDMSLILMSFFVLQLAYSTPDRRKYDNLSTAIAQSAKDAKPVENLKTLQTKVRKVIKDKNLEKLADVTYDVNGLAIEFRDQTLFEPGSAAPNPANRKVVEQVLEVIAKAPGDYKLVFEGHTDDVPMAGGKYASNWDLSSARGIALLDAFKAKGVSEKRMSVMAFAHTRPKVAYTELKGDELKKARAANRRVVIRIE